MHILASFYLPYIFTFHTFHSYLLAVTILTMRADTLIFNLKAFTRTRVCIKVSQR